MIFKKIKAVGALLATAVLFTFGSCQDSLVQFRTGELIRFSAGIEMPTTRATYSNDNGGTIERIDWNENDLIRIYCAQASEPKDNKYADYKVSSVTAATTGSAVSTAVIEGTGGVGLRWGSGDHTFYAAYPSPEAEGITTSIAANVVTAELPAVQAIASLEESDGNYVAKPDLKNMLMTSSSVWNPTTGIPDASVFLNFTTLTTAIQFTIKNGTGRTLNLVDLQLISGNGRANAAVTNGVFTVDLENSAKPADEKPYDDSEYTVTYSRSYPSCTGTNNSTVISDRTLTIPVGTESEPLELADGKTLSFTFFLVPTHHFRDLTFKFTEAGGGWKSTRLGYTDDDGIFFPRFKKSAVNGLLIPEGAQWYLNYLTSVTPWDEENGISDSFDATQGLE